MEEYQDDALLTNNVGTKVAIISGTTGNDSNESGFSNSKLLDGTSLKRDHERLMSLKLSSTNRNLNQINFHIFDLKPYRNSKEEKFLEDLDTFNPDAVVLAWQYSLQVKSNFFR